jgi:hypothetical protein
MNTWLPRDIQMSYLLSLKLVSSVRSNQLPPVQYRRNKLIQKLQEQLKCVKARIEGHDHIVTIQRLDKNQATGTRKYIQVPYRIRPWWYQDPTSGKFHLELRYGSRRIELDERKTGIEVDSMENLIEAIEILILAVQDGELDESISALVRTRRNRC